MAGILNILAAVKTGVAAAIDSYFNLTTLLLPGNGTNGAQNNTFLDSSTNNFTITRNGNTTQGTFSPFSQTGWSNYFASNSGIRFADSADFSMGTNAFTIECFVYLTKTQSAGSGFISQWVDANDSNSSWQLGVDWNGGSGGNKFAGQLSIGGTVTTVNDTTNFTLNTWHHVVLCRSGSPGTVALFVDGVRVASTSLTGSIVDATNPVGIGVRGGSDSYYMDGVYISNARVVNGTDVYGATNTTLTVPTAPLTAITNTKLLTCQGNRFLDANTQVTAKAVSQVLGTPSVQAFSPFAPTAAYSAATNGGSGYFDGSGDYLTAPADAKWRFGSGDFTIEAYVYIGSGSSYNLAFHWNGTTSGTVTGTTAVRANSWNHVAVTRTGTTLNFWINGVGDASNPLTVSSTIYNNTDLLAIGKGADHTAGAGMDICHCGETGGVSNKWFFYLANSTVGSFVGYMSWFRISSSVRYTANFTPPSAPTTSDANTSLLLNFTNAGIYDGTMKNNLETVGNAQISTTQSKFGGSSMSFPATNGNYCIGPPNQQNLLFGTGQFTIELWVYPTAFTNTAAGIVGYGLSGGYVDWNLELNTSGTLLYIDNDTGRVSASSNLSLNAWTHIAVVRTATAVTVYFNGTSVATYSTINNISGSSTSARLYVGTGAQVPASRQFIGYIDDLRITKYARYVSNFSVPAAPFALQ
jgi:hypothetical protein